MLLELHIQNFVLIEQLHLDLPLGLSVITGETGAGKSLTLAAIGLLLGERSQAHLVAAGATQADMSARFDTAQLPAANIWLAEHDFLDESTGIGLENLEKRLKINFGEKATFNISEKDKWITAMVVLPLEG